MGLRQATTERRASTRLSNLDQTIKVLTRQIAEIGRLAALAADVATDQESAQRVERSKAPDHIPAPNQRSKRRARLRTQHQNV